LADILLDLRAAYKDSLGRSYNTVFGTAENTRCGSSAFYSVCYALSPQAKRLG